MGANPEILEALTAGMQAEVASYIFYLKASQSTLAEKIKEPLEKLAYEEKDHYMILEKKFDAMVRSEKWISTTDILKQEGLPEINEEMNEVHSALIKEVTETDSIEEILDIAYRLEVEAFEMFNSAAKRVSTDDGKKMFSSLARIEEGHMEIISHMKDELL